MPGAVWGSHSFMATQCKLVLISEQYISAWHLFLPSLLGCLSSQAGLFCFISPSWKLIYYFTLVCEALKHVFLHLKQEEPPPSVTFPCRAGSPSLTEQL